MTYRSVISYLVILLAVHLNGLLWGDCPQATGYTAPSTSRTQIEGYPDVGDLFYYLNGSSIFENVLFGVNSTYPYTFGTPGWNANGTYSSASGNFASATYAGAHTFSDLSGNSTVYIKNSSNQGSSSCTPGVNCDACQGSETSNGWDCTGTHLPRVPSIYLESFAFAAPKGFAFRGNFSGRLSNRPTGSTVIPAAYFHQSQDYIGGSEFGFFYDETVPQVDFYWNNNTNCSSIASSVTACYDAQASANPFTDDPSHHGLFTDSGTKGTNGSNYVVSVAGCKVPVSSIGTTYTYQAEVFYDTNGSKYKFFVRVLDGSGTDVITPMVVDPNDSGYVSGAAYYPIQNVSSFGSSPSNGHITVGTIRIDPTNAQTWNTSLGNPPQVYLEGVYLVN